MRFALVEQHAQDCPRAVGPTDKTNPVGLDPDDTVAPDCEWRFNTDLLNVGQRPPVAPGVNVPPGLNQPIVPVRWIGRPWRNFGGSNIPIGPEPVLHPGGGPVSTPGAPGVPPVPSRSPGLSQPPPGKPPF